MMNQALREKISKIKLVIVDVDGVLTDGRIIFGDHGDELKFFDVQDGHGLVMLVRAGLKTAMMSAKKSRVNLRRAKELKMHKVYQNVHDKLKGFQKALKRFKVGAEEVCYIGDDLVDIPVLKRAGFAVAVQGALPEAKAAADHVTERPGGRGAVREVADMILKAQGRWDAVTERYFR